MERTEGELHTRIRLSPTVGGQYAFADVTVRVQYPFDREKVVLANVKMSGALFTDEVQDSEWLDWVLGGKQPDPTPVEYSVLVMALTQALVNELPHYPESQKIVIRGEFAKLLTAVAAGSKTIKVV